MQRFSFHTLKYAAQKVLIVCMVALICSTAFGAHIPRARAAIDYEPLNTVQNTLSAVANAITSGNIELLVTKEFALDAIAFDIAKIALRQITKSTLRWINSGFQGSPAFITDLQGFLLQSADEVIGNFIYGSDLGFLCSPFQLNVRLALQYGQQDFRDRVQCTLSGIAGNVENFLGGNFLEGGWPGWFELTTNPSNNPFGATAIAEIELGRLLNERRTIDLNKLLWGSGFLGSEECTQEAGDGVDGESEKKCTTVTPGKTISDALTFELSTGERALIEADEINEIIGALFAQLGKQALQGAAGLLGLTRTGGSFGSTSYLDRIDNPLYDTTTKSTAAEAGRVTGTAIADENQYRGLYAGVVSRSEGIVGRIDSLTLTCPRAESFRGQVAPILQQALGEQNAADANLSQLRNLESRYTLATPAEQQQIIEEFLALKKSGKLHSSITIARDQYNVDPLIGELNAISTNLSQECTTGGTTTNTGNRGE